MTSDELAVWVLDGVLGLVLVLVLWFAYDAVRTVIFRARLKRRLGDDLWALARAVKRGSVVRREVWTGNLRGVLQYRVDGVSYLIRRKDLVEASMQDLVDAFGYCVRPFDGEKDLPTLERPSYRMLRVV